MNDDEIKNRLARLRIPLSDRAAENEALQKALSALRTAGMENSVSAAAPRWTWRDWLWPSPVVWSGFAAVWFIVIVRGVTSERTVEHAVTRADAEQRPTFAQPSPLMARHDFEELLRQMQGERRTP